MDANELQRRLNEFQATANEVLTEVKEITSQQIKHWIVSPLLVALGWDPHDKRQVYLDFPIEKGKGHADYALLDPSGRPKLILEVYPEKTAVRTAAQAAAEKAKSVEAPLVFLTNGQEYSLWYVAEKEGPAPLFVLNLRDLPDNAEAFLGLLAEYRLSDTGIEQLRRSAITLAVLQMLEDNSEKTFDAMVEWVQSQVAPGALDEPTSAAIRDATMMWLTEEHLSMPLFSAHQGPHRPHDLRPTGARDWDPYPKGPVGTFQYKFDTGKTLDVRQSPKEVKQALRMQGLRPTTATAFGGFYYSLRQRAGLPIGSSAEPKGE